MELALLANLFVFLGTFVAGFKTAYDSAVEDNASSSDSTDDGYAYDQIGTAGNDTVTALQENTSFLLGAGDDVLTASAGNDLGNLGAGNDSANMGAGQDVAYGGDGADSIWGGMGSDSIFGDAGNDTLSGFIPDFGADDTATAADGSDVLFGGAGNDVLILGHGDRATGGAGNDVFSLDTRWDDGGSQMLVQDFTRGSDVLNIIYTPSASGAAPSLTIARTADGTGSVISLDGTAVATVAGVNTLVAGDVNLVASPVTDSGYVAANYGQEVIGTSAGEASSASKSTALFAGAGDDTFTGSGADDYADMGTGNDSAGMGVGSDSALGGAGDDTLRGGAGDDTLRGNDGADSLEGETGSDLIYGGAGADQIDGGSDNDNIYVGAGDDSALGGFGNDTLRGDVGNDTLLGDAGNDAMSGGDGADTVQGGLGLDLIYGDAGADKLSGDDGADSVYGGDGADTLQGFGLDSDNTTTLAQNDGVDSLYGGSGNDVIWAGAGDRAYGGDGVDSYQIVENQFGSTGLTRIEDFAAGETIVVHYPAADGAPVITIAASPVAGEVNILADGLVIARVVDSAGALTLASISTVAI